MAAVTQTVAQTTGVVPPARIRPRRSAGVGSAAGAATRRWHAPNTPSGRKCVRATSFNLFRCRATAGEDDARAPGMTRADETETTESREVLDAFFVGKALAETLLERAGGALSDVLGEVAKFDAERREDVRQFQEDVLGKAREEMYRQRAEEDQMR